MDTNKRITLHVALCSTQLFQNKEDILSKLEKYSNKFQYTNLCCTNKIPMEAAPTKELMEKWSEEYWPLVWRGNPNNQILNDYTFDFPFIEEIIKKISKLSVEEQEKGNKMPVVSAFVDPLDTTNVIYATDSRHMAGALPLDHSILNGINTVAEKLTLRKSENPSVEDDGYLCLNFDVYTTHEPCSMCAMALIHSRIKRCIFVKEMKNTGALKPDSGDGYCMHSNRLLNSKYEVFQWIGEDYGTSVVNDVECC